MCSACFDHPTQCSDPLFGVHPWVMLDVRIVNMRWIQFALQLVHVTDDFRQRVIFQEFPAPCAWSLVS